MVAVPRIARGRLGPDLVNHAPRIVIARLRWRHLGHVEDVRALHLATADPAGLIRWVDVYGHNIATETREDWIDLADIRDPGQPFIDDPWSFANLWPARVITLEESTRPGPPLP